MTTLAKPLKPAPPGILYGRRRHPQHLDQPPKPRSYPEDHVARRDEESCEPFNADWAREDFGDEYISRLQQEQPEFRGDWWLLGVLLYCTELGPDHRRLKDPRRRELWARVICQGVPVHLEGAKLPGLNLRRFRLNGVHLEHADLTSAQLGKADLGGVRLQHAWLQNTYLTWANLMGARLERANCPFARLRNAHLTVAHLEDSNLMGADLVRAKLDSAKLNGANLQGAKFADTDLAGAVLDYADVRQAEGITFDSNPVERLHIEGSAPDPWSRLRRSYTGPRFFLHLLFLFAYLSPHGANALYLSAIAEVHDAGATVIERIEFDSGDGAPDETTRAVSIIQPLKHEFEQTHNRVPVIWILIGGLKGWPFVMLTGVLAVYNGCRLFLTYRVSMLREAEERAKVTPRKSDYLWLYQMHRMAVVPSWLSIASAVFNLGVWAISTWVWVPA